MHERCPNRPLCAAVVRPKSNLSAIDSSIATRALTSLPPTAAALLPLRVATPVNIGLGPTYARGLPPYFCIASLYAFRPRRAFLPCLGRVEV